MKKRKLGSTDLELTALGVGTWAIGGPWQCGWGPQDDGEAVAAILGAIDQGVNWIDTAPIYGCGHSEELVAKALAQTREKPIIATKCGLLWDDRKRKINSLKKDSIRRECDASLKRLGVDVIDLYQIHHPSPDEDIAEAWEEMAKLREQGKVRYLGVSNFSVEQIECVRQIHPVASLQPIYSMLHREIEGEVLGYCEKNNIGVIAYSTMQRGLLTGKFSYERLANLASDDYRLQNIEFQPPRFGLILELVEQLKIIAEKNTRPLSQIAISWVLRRKEITAAIVGARNRAQIAETAGAADFGLPEEDVEKIETLLARYEEKVNAELQ